MGFSDEVKREISNYTYDPIEPINYIINRVLSIMKGVYEKKLGCV